MVQETEVEIEEPDDEEEERISYEEKTGVWEMIRVKR